MSLFEQCARLLLFGFGQRRRGSRGLHAPARQRAPQPRGHRHQQHEGSDPQQPGGRFDGRLVEHEVAVALHHVVEDLALALAGAQLFADLVLQVGGQVGARGGDGLVLAHQAAQLVGDGQHALLERRVLGHRTGFLRGREQGGQRAGQGDQQLMH